MKMTEGRMMPMEIVVSGSLGLPGCPGRPPRRSWTSTFHYIWNLRVGALSALRRAAVTTPIAEQTNHEREEQRFTLTIAFIETSKERKRLQLLCVETDLAE